MPRTTRARVPTRETNSATSRDFPTPGSPTTVTRRQTGAAATEASSRSSSSSCSARPVKGVPPRRTGGRRSATSSRRYALTGVDFPLASIAATGSARTTSRTSLYVASPISTWPGPAACSRRAATLTGSPVTNVSRSEASPATTSPVLTPMRSEIVVPKRRSSSSFSDPRRACISSAARHARTASSSCDSGTPNTARTASPTNFSTVPP